MKKCIYIYIGVDYLKLIMLFTDSANARLTALNPLNSARTRYIDIRYKWVIYRLQNSDFALEHVGTMEMVADGITKPLQRIKHAGFLKQLGVGPIPW